MLFDITTKVEITVNKYNGLNVRAAKAFTNYLKSYSMLNKEIFDVTTINLDNLAK